jgi:hypothetical protein
MPTGLWAEGGRPKRGAGRDPATPPTHMGARGQLRVDVERVAAALAAVEEALRPYRPEAAAELAELRAELMGSLATLARIERELEAAQGCPPVG